MMTEGIGRSKLAGIEFTGAGSAEPSADTLICLHGIGGDDSSFLPQIEFLADRYQVVSWNMPGYAGSETLPEYTFQRLAAALYRLIDALNVSRVHLIGQSIGGMIAQEFVNRHPDNVKTLTLIATTSAFGGRDDSFKDAFLKARLAPLDNGMTMAALAENSIPQIMGAKAPASALESAIQSMSKVSSQAYRDVLRCLVTFNRFSAFQEIGCPVCLIAGSEDTNSPAVTMKKMADRLPQAEFHELRGAGHLVNLEMPEQSNEIIARFLNKNS